MTTPAEPAKLIPFATLYRINHILGSLRLSKVPTESVVPIVRAKSEISSIIALLTDRFAAASATLRSEIAGDPTLDDRLKELEQSMLRDPAPALPLISDDDYAALLAGTDITVAESELLLSIVK